MQMVVNNNLSYGRGYVYNIQYHIVWCTKYRKPVLINETEQSLKESLQQTAETIKINIVEMECMPDHIHLLVECSPQHFIPDMIKVLKGNSARAIFIANPDLKKQLWGGHLWNPSYFIATVSDNTRKQIQNTLHLKKQETDERGLRSENHFQLCCGNQKAENVRQYYKDLSRSRFFLDWLF